MTEALWWLTKTLATAAGIAALIWLFGNHLPQDYGYDRAALVWWI